MVEHLVTRFLRSVDTARMMDDLRRIAGFDRYQASLGLDGAARIVAEAAVDAGLRDVAVHDHQADGKAQWWTFEAPVSWTPLTGTLRVTGQDGPVVDLDHVVHPFAVATYSAATRGVVTVPLVRRTGDLEGALVVVDRDEYRDGGLLAELDAAGALGFVTDATSKGDQRGRIELTTTSRLLAFSLTPAEFSHIVDLRGLTGRVEVAVDRSAAMPVVSGVLPGEGDGEVWLTAHLCHPRPSANDNASGVAALLGAARALTAVPGRRAAVRFFWGAEFVGTAAILHRLAVEGGRPPLAVINLDMVGEDQALCASPFVVERSPDTLPSLLTPLAERVVHEAFAATADSPGTWQSSPFLGFSDHALFADPSVGSPAVQFCHPADRFNHSAADTIDKVSPVEMTRSTAAAAALAHLVASGGPAADEVDRVLDWWCEREVARAEEVAAAHGGEWGRRLREHVDRGNARLRALAVGADFDRMADQPDEQPVSGAWDGPLNLRAMTAHLPEASRHELGSLIAADKNCLAVLFNLAIRADGRTGRSAIIEDTSLALGRPLDPVVTGKLFDALEESGWVVRA
ncbi:DUF4910 domain-containing protein [Saccharothrix isguenensis]